MFLGQDLFNQPGQLVIGRVIQDLKTLGTIVIGPGFFLPTGTGPETAVTGVTGSGTGRLQTAPIQNSNLN